MAKPAPATVAINFKIVYMGKACNVCGLALDILGDAYRNAVDRLWESQPAGRWPGISHHPGAPKPVGDGANLFGRPR